MITQKKLLLFGLGGLLYTSVYGKNCYIEVQKNENAPLQIVESTAIRFISKYVQPVTLPPISGVTAQDCVYKLSVSNSTRGYLISITGENLNLTGASKKTDSEGLTQAFQEAFSAPEFKTKNSELYKGASEDNAKGEAYAKGLGVHKNEKEAFRWYKKSAEQGFAPAQVNLGKMYYTGKGVVQDEQEAVRWFQLAAEQGNPLGQNWLGLMYQLGDGIKQSYPEAFKWYKKAAEQGNAEGEDNVGYMYLQGYVVKKDFKVALDYFKKSAKKDNPLAQVHLGYMYQMGFGVPKDESEAVRLYRLAADQGNSWGKYRLGFMYMYGYGVEKNEQKAIQLYQQASK
ncbi:tetratricopeptide repeat protein [Deltaproteobacteria bacterium TL4]